MHTCKCTDPILSSVVLNESHSFIVTNMVPDMEMTKRMLQVMSEKEEKAYHADYLDYRDSLMETVVLHQKRRKNVQEHYFKKHIILIH